MTVVELMLVTLLLYCAIDAVFAWAYRPKDQNEVVETGDQLYQDRPEWAPYS